MQPQEYKILQFKKGDFQDAHLNYWCDMALEGVSEPVRIAVKDPMTYSDGMTLYGHITDETSKAGKPYRRFRKDQRDEGQQSFSGASPSKSNYKTDDHTQESIARSVALKAAVDYLNGQPEIKKNVLGIAEEFLAWLQGGNQPTETKTEQTGYDKAKAQADAIKERQTDDQALDSYTRTVVQEYEGEPFDLSQIPY